jgi:uncharacterized membrane protein
MPSAPVDSATEPDEVDEVEFLDLVTPKGWRHSRSWIFGTMLFSACMSLIAAFVLSVDAVALAADKHAALACNINSVISCGTVGVSWQATVFGFPNAFLGLIFEPIVITLALAGLAGVRFPRWFMFGAQILYTFALAFAFWLFCQAMFVIHALCPWCLVVTISTSLVFVTLLHANVLQDHLYLPPRAQRRAMELIRSDVDAYFAAIFVVLLLAAIVLKYGASLFG